MSKVSAPRAWTTQISVGSGRVSLTVHCPAETPLAMLLRRRGGVEERLLAVTGTPDAWTFAVAVSDVDGPLAEGIWDVYAVFAGARGDRPVRLADAGGPLESNAYLHPLLIAPDGDLQVYITDSGNVSFEVRPRRPHLEVREVRLAGGRLLVTGRPHRALLAGSATVVVAQRSGTTRYEFPAEVSDGVLRWEIQIGRLLDVVGLQQQIWDLFVTGRDGGSWRVAGLLDDIRRKASVVSFPAHAVAVGEEGWRLRPYYTRHNGLSLRVRPYAAEQGGTAPGHRLAA
jgi:hypothetical protein